jgi:hypothetical protein
VSEFIDRIVSGTTNEVGRRTLMVLITTWDMAGGGPFAATSIATVGLSKTVDTVQTLFMGPVFDPLLRLGADNVKFRASLCVWLIGLGGSDVAPMRAGHSPTRRPPSATSSATSHNRRCAPHPLGQAALVLVRGR